MSPCYPSLSLASLLLSLRLRAYAAGKDQAKAGEAAAETEAAPVGTKAEAPDAAKAGARAERPQEGTVDDPETEKWKQMQNYEEYTKTLPSSKLTLASLLGKNDDDGKEPQAEEGENGEEERYEEGEGEHYEEGADEEHGEEYYEGGYEEDQVPPPEVKFYVVRHNVPFLSLGLPSPACLSKIDCRNPC
jgi:hypothetical protein